MSVILMTFFFSQSIDNIRRDLMLITLGAYRGKQWRLQRFTYKSTWIIITTIVTLTSCLTPIGGLPSPNQVSRVHLKIIAVPDKQAFWGLFVIYYCSMLLLLLLLLLFGFKPTLHFWYALMWVRDAAVSHTFLSWSDYLTAWSSYESHVLVLIWLSDCVMQLWVTLACPNLTIWLRDAVMSHTCLSWSDNLTPWCRPSQRPTFHPCSPSNLQ